MKIVAITQARTGSSRFPQKILKKINGISLLEIHIERIRQSSLIDKIIIATTSNLSDNIIEDYSKLLGIECYRGKENDVLDRFYKSVVDIKPDFIVRLTSDCTLIDAKLIDEIIENALKKNLDYYSNVLYPTYPDGQDIEVFKFSALKKACETAQLIEEREHVTPFIKNNSSFMGKNIFTSENHQFNNDYNKVRIVVDYKEDFKVIEMLIKKLGLNAEWIDYANEYIKDQRINSNNIKIKRNDGYYNSKN